jgi:excisionase family DNA binding protein
LLQISISTVKRWADEGILPCVKTHGGHRRFRRRDVERMRGEPHHQPPRRRASVGAWLDLLLSNKPIDVVVARLLAERGRRGAWWRVAESLAGLLEEVGLLWQHGALSIVEEHVLSERLARAVAWVAQTVPVAGQAPWGLLLTAEGDEHTLGLSLADLTAREAGWNIRWSGRATPVAEVVRVMAAGEVDLVGVSASRASENAAALTAQLQPLAAAARLHEVALLIGGAGAWPALHGDLAHVRRVHDLRQLFLLLQQLRNRDGAKGRGRGPGRASVQWATMAPLRG